MKRHAIIMVLFFLISCSGYAFGSTTFVSIDDSLDLSNITAFQFDVIMDQGFTDEDFSPVILTPYYSGESVSVGAKSMNGAVPNSNWDLFKVKSPWIGVAGYDKDWGDNTLSLGILCSLEGDVSFTLDNFILVDGFGGAFPDDVFSVVVSRFEDGTLYELGAPAPVPVPPTVLLLGAGTLGLFAARRRSLQV